MPTPKPEGDEALIHLRVPAATKARWVRESRAEGMRLGDWIVQRVESPTVRPVTIAIPSELEFSALRLSRDADGNVSFDTEVIARICRASGLPDDFFLAQSEDGVAGLIVQWYRTHRAAGGAPDAVAEDLFREAQIEDERGSLSHQPGRA